MDPLVVNLWILVGVIVVTLVLSLVTGEDSWVDRIWSIVPVAYTWVFAAASGLTNGRLVLMAVLVTAWGARLTFNFARKGGYARGGEDYRWVRLRARIPRWQFVLFTVFFIAIIQNVVLLLITVPAWTMFEHPAPLGWADAVVAVLFVACLVGETVADEQQWRFQRAKHAAVAAGRAPARQFRQTGLFRWSRHPAFFFEQLQWWLIFVFGTIAAGSVLQWTVIGAVLLSLLFVASTAFTESISLSRYPEYADYRKTTSAVIPWPPR